MSKSRLVRIGLPDFGMPDAMPEIPAPLYPARVARLRELADERGYDRVVVCADREHSANLSFLTGFDPRFEEAPLVLGSTGEPAILVGAMCPGSRSIGCRRRRRSLPGGSGRRVLADVGIVERENRPANGLAHPAQIHCRPVGHGRQPRPFHDQRPGGRREAEVRESA